MNQALTVGVIGHVDHGKTALVRALTGIETDRLKEERERGLSIVLGFSYLETERGTVDLIDVPGHEDFIRAMISGATGLDGVLLVIAANEGVMPQTREHFDIACLLGVECGIVVITKSDLVTEEAIELLREEIAEFVDGSFLENAPVMTASSITEDGQEQVRKALVDLAGKTVGRNTDVGFYLPLDRVFNMRGFGVVGTGTLRGGALNIDSRVQILPGGDIASVRALQVHNRATDTALPGQRVAVNFRHLGREDVKRGDTIAQPGLLKPTTRIDVELKTLETAPSLKNGVSVRLLFGTNEVIAKLRVLEQRAIAPGDVGFVQLRCDREVVTHPDERFVIRSYSPMRTIGGGRFLDVNPPRHRRFDAAVNARLATAANGDTVDILKQRLEDAGVEGLHVESARENLDLSDEALNDLLSLLEAHAVNEELWVAAEAFSTLRDHILASLAQFHDANPHRQGMPRAALEHAITPVPNRIVLDYAVRLLSEDGEVGVGGDAVTLADFDPMGNLDEQARQLARNLEHTFIESGLAPPAVDQLLGTSKANRHVYRLLLDYGRLVQLKTYDRKQKLVLHAETVEGAKQKIASEFPRPETFAVKDIRDLLGSTRKFVVPLMEHFDATGFTIRMGDARQLRED